MIAMVMGDGDGEGFTFVSLAYTHRVSVRGREIIYSMI